MTEIVPAEAGTEAMRETVEQAACRPAEKALKSPDVPESSTERPPARLDTFPERGFWEEGGWEELGGAALPGGRMWGTVYEAGREDD